MANVSGRDVGNIRNYQESLADYADEHRCYDLFASLIKALVVEKPKDPLTFLMRRVNHVMKLQVAVVGPRGVGSSSVSALVAEQLDLFLIRDEVIFATLGLSSDAAATDEDIVDAIVKICGSTECQGGFIVDGFPRNKKQATLLQAAGVLVTHFIMLEASRPLLFRRGTHLQHVVQSSIDDFVAVCRAYADGPSLFRVNTDPLELDGVVKRCLDICSRIPCLNAPKRSRRILLLGPPGAGRTVVGMRLAETYGCVQLSVKQVIEAAIEAETPDGVTAKVLRCDGHPVPVDLVASMLNDRLTQEDCRTHGWIFVDHFPENKDILILLAQLGHFANAVLDMQINEEVAAARLSGRRVDPLTGKIYHVTTGLPTHVKVRQRIVTAPSDTPPAVEARVKAWKSVQKDILLAAAKLGPIEAIDASKPLENVVEMCCAAIERPAQAKA